jgi:hypothetical protein
MGFIISPGRENIDDVAVTPDYNRPGDPKVLFEKML